MVLSGVSAVVRPAGVSKQLDSPRTTAATSPPVTPQRWAATSTSVPLRTRALRAALLWQPPLSQLPKTQRRPVAGAADRTPAAHPLFPHRVYAAARTEPAHPAQPSQPLHPLVLQCHRESHPLPVFSDLKRGSVRHQGVILRDSPHWDEVLVLSERSPHDCIKSLICTPTWVRTYECVRQDERPRIFPSELRKHRGSHLRKEK